MGIGEVAVAEVTLAQLVIDTLTPILRGSAKATVDHYAEELEDYTA